MRLENRSPSAEKQIMKTGVMKAGALACILIVGSTLVGFACPQGDGNQLSDDEALGLVRTVVTVELTIFMKNQVYVSLGELLQHPSFRPKVNVTKTDRNYGRVEDYRISVVASADGKHYSAELTPAAPHLGCPAAFFSNERAIIYKAKALGCYEASK
jgi:hypothetical protein